MDGSPCYRRLMDCHMRRMPRFQSWKATKNVSDTLGSYEG